MSQGQREGDVALQDPPWDQNRLPTPSQPCYGDFAGLPVVTLIEMRANVGVAKVIERKHSRNSPVG